jgi:GT2 family glycosyltransferase
MKQKLVSGVLTTYNGDRALRHQLNSIYNPTYRPLDVIVVGDISSNE